MLGVSEYKILSEIPEFLENTLPSIEDIEKRLENDDNDWWILRYNKCRLL